MTKEECISLLNSYAEYGNIGIPNLIRFREAMRTATELLQQPSLPSNLDEAAEEYAYRGIPDIMKPTVKPLADEIVKNFKTGVEWMAKQGETHETEIVSRINARGLLPAVTCLVDNSYKEGDKVIVQIRKVK